MPDPLLSVVVPIYDVGSYLAPCLDSLIASSLTDLEIICVNDGSTDGSGELADEYAKRDERIRVLHVENGGLGRARNIGLDVASGRYLAFVDSDDRVPVRAYELMCGSLESSGSDIAAGRVRRFTDTRSWSSGLHAQAIPRPARATHITRTPSLVYDTTAWNKVFRRSFWDEHALRFPEGMLYEDMPVTIPAHVLARSVDLLTSHVYEWRERGDGSMSITQRRAEQKNLQDRLAALESVSDFLGSHDVPKVLRAHDRKVLTLDIPLYLTVLDVADDEYRQYFAQHMRHYLEHVDPVVIDQLDVWYRVAFELLRRDRVEETVQLMHDRRATKAEYDVRRKGLRLLAELPYLGDRAVGLPDKVFDVTTKLPVRCSIDDATISGSTLTVTGMAMISKVPLTRPWSAVRYVELRGPSGHRVVRPARPRRRPDATAIHGTARAGYDLAGYAVRIPLDKLKVEDGASSGYTVQMKIVTPAARRGVSLNRGGNPRGRTPLATAILADGTYVAVYTSTGSQLRVTARRDHVFVERAVVEDGGRVRCDLRSLRPIPADATLRWRIDEGERIVTGQLVPDPSDPTRAVGRLDLADLGPDVADSEADFIWRAAVECGPAEEPTLSMPLVAAADTAVATAVGGPSTEASLSIGGGGRLTLTVQRRPVTVESVRWSGGRLRVRVGLPAGTSADEASVVFLRGWGNDILEPVERQVSGAVDGAGVTVTAVFEFLRPAEVWSVPPGTWTLRVTADDAEQPESLPLAVDEDASLAGSTATDQPVAFVRTAAHRLSVVVWANRVTDRGDYNQARLIDGPYLAAQQTPLRELVLFQSWAGKQFSDSPRALYEEMLRQGRDVPALWVRRDTSVALPPNTPSVVLGSREYFEALATARYVVANDAMPTFYAKRAGSRYLQTWHGTPLKRIGFDIENAQFGNVNYLAEFAVEVTKWDRLISPNRFSTEIFRRAFDYHGEIIETGYPRNDVFYAPDVEQRRQALRQRLGLLPHQRVILWAPTWREDQRDAAGRYTLPLPFDLATWDRILQPDDVLLFRGHQLIQATVGGMLRGLRQVRNVTLYPDIQDLYLVADLLITDYSSVMFDFANTRRPMIFYAWDLDHYRDHLRGFYLDFEATVPGPVVTDLDTLQERLAEPDPGATHADAYRRFVERFCSLEDGHAAERALAELLGD